MGQKYVIQGGNKTKVTQVPLEKYAASVSQEITSDTVKKIGDSLGVDWNIINADELLMGTQHERKEHPLVIKTDAQAVQIALDHLKEIPDYYTRLKSMEPENA